MEGIEDHPPPREGDDGPRNTSGNVTQQGCIGARDGKVSKYQSGNRGAICLYSCIFLLRLCHTA